MSFEHCTGPVCIQWQNASCLQFAVCRMRHNLSSWASIMCLCSVALHKHMSSGESHGSEVKILTRSAHWRKAIKKKSTLEKGNSKCTGEKQYKKSILKKSNEKKSALEKGNKKKSPQVKSKQRKVHWRKAIYKSCAKHNLHISGLPHCWCWLSDRGK